MRNNTGAADAPSDRADHEASGSGSSDAKDPNATSSHARLTILEAELADMRDRWMRAEAEIANVRGRAKREVEDVRKFAVQNFAADVVEAAENLRRGLGSIPPRSDSEPSIITKLREGFLGVENSFLALLERNGIAKEDPIGCAFDPKRHEAMSEAASSSQPPGTVVEALTSAWSLHGRLLRPAMVVVAKAPKENPVEGPTN